MTSKKEFPKGTLALFGSIILLLIVVYLIQTPNKNTVPKDLIAVLRPSAIPLQPFKLLDQNKQVFMNNHLKGKWSFVFFGYTHCPDICPTTLSTLKQVNSALKKHPQAAKDLQVVFVSVDPARDKPETLAEYTAYFNKEFIAVTGFTDNLLGFSKQFAAGYRKEKADTQGNYLISHTSSIFLVDPKTRIVAAFAPPHYAETITSQYLKIHDLF